VIDLAKTSCRNGESAEHSLRPASPSRRGAELSVPDLTTDSGLDSLLELVTDIEQQVARLRRTLEGAMASQRDLLGEIEGVLSATPGITTPEVARAIHARESEVRAVLRNHPARFHSASNMPGRSPLARCWILSDGASATQPDTSAEVLEGQP